MGVVLDSGDPQCEAPECLVRACLLSKPLPMNGSPPLYLRPAGGRITETFLEAGGGAWVDWEEKLPG